MKSPKPSSTVPGPVGNRFFGPIVSESRRDPLGFMMGLAREYGDVCSFRVGLERIFYVNHPDYIRDVLVNHYGSFIKGRGGRRAKQLLGNGLLLSEGELHRRQRRLAQPAFHRQRIASYAEVMADYAARFSARWQQHDELEVSQEMLRLTLAIVGKTLFSADVESKSDEVGQAMMAATYQFRAFKLPFAGLFERLPVPRVLRFRRGQVRLRRIIQRVIAERRQSGEDTGDLLSMLLLAGDESAGGERMTPLQVWDEALTLFIAGYDTMSTTLMWTWYLLSQHTEVETRLHAEVDAALADGRPATFDDLKRLPYTERVIAESMRLYPPTWRLVRRALSDFEVGGHTVPAGSLVVMCQYVMHRDARYYTDPETFDPERFTPDAKATRPQFSYFPFGGGPRRCLGEPFALMEGVILLASLARHWRLRLVPGHPIEMLPLHLLRSKHGMMMRLEKR